MAINLASKFSTKVDERFTQKSLTDAHAGHNYEFSGVNSVKTYSVDAVEPTDYKRNGLNRYGEPTELGDTVQEMAMVPDRGFNFTVDAGNASEQLNIKQVVKRIKINWDEKVTPEIDKYRFARWIAGAGFVVIGAAPTKTTAVELVMDATEAMGDALVPLDGRTLFVTNRFYKLIKLSDEFINIEALGKKSVAKGEVGEVDNMPVVRVPKKYLPDGVEFMVKYKNSTVDPQKLKNLRVHKNPPGIDGDLGECRYTYDSFVLNNKANGIYVYATAGVATPVIAVGETTTAITSTTSGASIYYTTDGSSPKDAGATSARKKYSAAVTNLPEGTVIKAYAEKDGNLTSGIAELTV